MATLRTSPPQPADIITYRLGDELVYVKPASTFQEAVEVAQKEFPVLQTVSSSNITFTITASMGGHKHTVRISESAWSPTIARVLRGEVIDIVVGGDSEKLGILPMTSHRRISDAAADPPPRYLVVPGHEPERSRHVRVTKSNPNSRRSSPSPSRIAQLFGK